MPRSSVKVVKLVVVWIKLNNTSIFSAKLSLRSSLINLGSAANQANNSCIAPVVAAVNLLSPKFSFCKLRQCCNV